MGSSVRSVHLRQGPHQVIRNHVSRRGIIRQLCPQRKIQQNSFALKTISSCSDFNLYKLRDTALMYIHRPLQMAMFLYFAWEHIAELHRHIQQQTRTWTTGLSLHRTLYTTAISTSMDHCYREGDRQNRTLLTQQLGVKQLGYYKEGFAQLICTNNE